MPPRPIRSCRFPGCGILLAGGGLCDAHRRPAWLRTTGHVPLPRNWRTLRDRVMRRDGHRCVLCQNVAASVDHIVARRFGGTDQLDNLRALCARHAREKDALDAAAGRWGKPRRTENAENTEKPRTPRTENGTAGIRIDRWWIDESTGWLDEDKG